VARRGIALQLVEHRETGAVGQVHVEHDRRDGEAPRRREAILRGVRDDGVELQLVREVPKDGGEVLVVLDDQKVAPAAAHGSPVVGDACPEGVVGRTAGRIRGRSRCRLRGHRE
jgi:hypothetical protein